MTLPELGDEPATVAAREAAVAPPAMQGGGHLRIERLTGGDRQRLLAHFMRLGEEGLRLRFGGCTSRESLAAHVLGLDFAAGRCFGASTVHGELVAVVEGHVYDADGQRQMELAFSTDPSWRSLGLASDLFEAVSADAARSGVRLLEARCDRRNRPMRAVLHGTRAATRQCADEVLARWPVGAAAPPAELPGFTHAVEVIEAHTARQLFATLPLATGFAGNLVGALATGILVANVESACILEMQPHLAAGETVVGTDVRLRHVAPALPGQRLVVRGSGRRLGARDVRFEVVVEDAQGVVASGQVTLAVVGARQFEERLARKARPLEAMAS